MRKIGLKPRALYVGIDTVLIILCTYVPYLLRYNQIGIKNLLRIPSIWQTLHLLGFSAYSFIFLSWGIFTILIFNNYHLYTTDRELTIPHETWIVFRAVTISSLPIVVGIFLFKVIIFSRLLFTVTLTCMFLSLSLWRTIKRVLIRRLIRKGFHNLNALIIGAGEAGRILAEEIKLHPYLGIKIIGFIDDFKERGHDNINGYPIIGKIDDFEKIVRQKFIDEVFITMPSQYKTVQNILDKGRKLGVNIKVIPDFYDLILSDIKLYHLGIIPLVGYHSKGIHGTDLVLKRMMDIFISGALLLFLSPLFLILAIFIKFDSPGPVFYRSKRCAKKGKIFAFYKFRSMGHNADKMLDALKDKNEKKGPIFKMKSDPRITRVGRFIRKLSLDELPQLWNVFKGDMSLVGPRPPTPEEVENYEPWQLRKLEIKPGITCIWQIRGRSDLSFYKWIKWDIWYIDNWSFWLDLKIMFETLPAVLKTKGAY